MLAGFVSSSSGADFLVMLMVCPLLPIYVSVYVLYCYINQKFDVEKEVYNISSANEDNMITVKILVFTINCDKIRPCNQLYSIWKQGVQ